MESSAKLSFYGGAEGVTGANYLLEVGDLSIVVDCGLFQGSRFAEEKNHEPFPYDPSKIDVVFITHAHADHVGRLPKLVKEGFHGKVISTPPTAALAEVMLKDAVKVMRHELEDGRASTEPLYGEEDLSRALELFTTYPYGQTIRLSPVVSFTLRDSAHILGSCMVEFQLNGTVALFTGDLGNTPTPLLGEIFPIEHADYVIMESVYGNRFHEPQEERKLLLERAIEDTVTAHGVLIIPVFALERTQEVLSELDELIEHNRIPRVPVFLDSPLAINATEVYRKFSHFFNSAAQEDMKKSDLFRFPGLTLTPSREESKKINDVPPPKIILAGNPHGYGSRIAHHFLRYLPDERNTVLFAGYARVSSLGRRLTDGAKEVRIGRATVPVRARILNISGYSSHADQNQLKQFVAHIGKPIQKVFTAMGEPESANALARVIRDELGIHAETPKLGTTVELSLIHE